MTSLTTSTATTVSASISRASYLNPTFTPNPDSDIPDYAQQWQHEMRASLSSVLSLLTPLNTTLLILTLYAFYRLVLSPSNNNITLPQGPEPIVFRTFTPRTLLPFNGKQSESNPDARVLLGVKGKVYDVSSGRNFYGPGGPYENFAGRDATRGLALQSFDDEVLTKNLDGPLDDLKGLDKEAMENLQGWVERFDEKYLVVGKLIAFKRTEFT